MIGGIIGDIIGSTYEFNPVRRKDFEFFRTDSTFTDDTVLTVATMDAILNNIPYGDAYRKYYRDYPNRGWGGMFRMWGLRDEALPYNSFGNGSAMRVGPVGWAFNSLDKVLEEAKKSAEVTHNHPEGIRGAQAVAGAIFLARTGKSKREIARFIEDTFFYDLDRSIGEIRKTSEFNETCMVSVPEAIICFLDSDSYEDAIRNAISLGADADTQACIAGSIAEAFYGEIPKELEFRALALLPQEFIHTVNTFSQHTKN